MHRETLHTGRRGRLTGLLWTGNDQPQGAVLVVHGLGDYAERFEPLANALVEKGLAVLGFDLPGHGHSPGGRGRADSFDGLLEEIDAARHTLAQRYPTIPQYVLGYSMGGNLVLNYALRQTMHNQAQLPSGLVLCAPMLLPPTPPPRPYIFAAWLTGLLFPWIRIDRPVDPSSLTGDPDQAAAIQHDPMMHSQITVYLATQLLSQGRWALDHARQLQIPTLILFGDEDSLIDRSACQHLAIRMGERAQLVSFQGMRHDLFHDTGTPGVLSTIGTWTKDLALSPSGQQMLED